MAVKHEPGCDLNHGVRQRCMVPQATVQATEDGRSRQALEHHTLADLLPLRLAPRIGRDMLAQHHETIVRFASGKWGLTPCVMVVTNQRIVNVSLIPFLPRDRVVIDLRAVTRIETTHAFRPRMMLSLWLPSLVSLLVGVGSPAPLGFLLILVSDAAIAAALASFMLLTRRVRVTYSAGDFERDVLLDAANPDSWLRTFGDLKRPSPNTSLVP